MTPTTPVTPVTPAAPVMIVMAITHPAIATTATPVTPIAPVTPVTVRLRLDVLLGRAVARRLRCAHQRDRFASRRVEDALPAAPQLRRAREQHRHLVCYTLLRTVTHHYEPASSI